ncbi:MAG: acyl--CoA ligase [Rhodobacteraceae bacterium]|nr:acyl--CoA ligase [Paracoccaceae bacterium]
MTDSSPPCPAPFNLTAHVLARAAELQDKPALEVLGDAPQVYSYARLQAAVRGCGTLLLQQGLPPGARVLMRLGNSPAFPVLFLAAIAVGLVPVPTSAALTGPEITRMAAAIAPALIVAEPGIALPEIDCPVLSGEAVLAAEGLPPCDYQMGDPERLAYIVFTSGTSGRALPVMHAHRAIWARRMMRDGWEGLRASDRLLHAGAFNWTYTLGTGLMDPWVAGATALIPAAGTAAADLPGMLVQARATIFAAAPGVFRQMLRARVPALPDLRHALSAGEAMPQAVAADWRAATGTLVHQAFGMSECSTFISGAPDRPAPPGLIGYPQPGRRVAVLDADGGPVGLGDAGTLAVHRSDPGLMLGYFGMAEETAARFAGDWFLTGDQVSEAADGALRYLGRGDDMMNPGGFRVSPLEVEAVLSRTAGVQECAVVEVEVAPGSRIIACIYTAATEIAEADLLDHAMANLARYKQPRGYIRLDALPRNANNKLNRSELRLIAAQHLCPQEGP